MKLGRRTALIGGVLGAGFVGVGWWFARERDRLGERTLFNIGAGEAGLNGWVKVTRDDRVIIAVPRAEMGRTKPRRLGNDIATKKLNVIVHRSVAKRLCRASKETYCC